MDCPVCHNAMITLELAQVEIDHCVECGGIWLDGGELEALIGDKEEVRDHPFAGPGDAIRRTPT